MGLAEVKAEVDSADGFDVTLAGHTVRVKPMRDWPANIMKFISAGDFDRFAEKCLLGDGPDVWARVDPTFAQLEDFLDQVNTATGQNLGK